MVDAHTARIFKRGGALEKRRRVVVFDVDSTADIYAAQHSVVNPRFNDRAARTALWGKVTTSKLAQGHILHHFVSYKPVPLLQLFAGDVRKNAA